MAVEKGKLTEVVRSFGFRYKKDSYAAGRDFFCSRKEECLVQDAKEVSLRLHQWCEYEVMRDVIAWKKKMTLPAKPKVQLKPKSPAPRYASEEVQDDLPF